MLGGRRGMARGRGANSGGTGGRPIPVHINGPAAPPQQQTATGKRPRTTPEAQSTPSKRRGTNAAGETEDTVEFQPRQQVGGSGGPPAGQSGSERDRNKKRRNRKQGGKASVAMARALGASEEAIGGLMSERQKEMAKERQAALNPALEAGTETGVREAAAKGDFGAMGLFLLDGIKKANANIGKMGAVLSKEQELFQVEVRDMLSDIGRQSRKVVLEFVSKRLVPGGGFWDDERLLKEVNALTSAKHGVTIPPGDVSAIHFKGGAHSGCVVVKFSCTVPSSAFGRLMNLRGQPGGWKGQPVPFDLLVRQQLTKQDRSIFDLMKWCKSHGQYMRDEAQKKGLNPIEVVPWDKLILYVRSSPQSGAVIVQRSGFTDLTLAKMSDVRGVTRQEWVDAYVGDISPHTWLEPRKAGGPGSVGGRSGGEEEMEVAREGSPANVSYDSAQVSSFLEDVERERERREAGGATSTRSTSTESPTAAMARLAVHRSGSISLTPSKPPSLDESPVARDRGSTSSGMGDAAVHMLDAADEYLEAERPNILEKHRRLLEESATPVPGAYPARPPPPPNRLRKRNLAERNAPLIPPPPAVKPLPAPPASKEKHE